MTSTCKTTTTTTTTVEKVVHNALQLSSYHCPTASCTRAVPLVSEHQSIVARSVHRSTLHRHIQWLNWCQINPQSRPTNIRPTNISEKHCFSAKPSATRAWSIHNMVLPVRNDCITGRDTPTVAFGVKDLDFTTPIVLWNSTIAAARANATIGIAGFAFFVQITTAFNKRHGILAYFVVVFTATRLAHTTRARTSRAHFQFVFHFFPYPNWTTNVFVIRWAWCGQKSRHNSPGTTRF